jgi:hypothetical protein
MAKKAANTREWYLHHLLDYGAHLVCVVVAAIVSVSVIVVIAGHKPEPENTFSLQDLVPGVIALAAMVFNLSQLTGAVAAEKATAKKEFLLVYMLFTSATAFFTLFLFLYPAYANMTDPHAAYSIPLYVTGISLGLASCSLVEGIHYLLRLMWSQWRDSGEAITPQLEEPKVVEQKGEAGSEVAKNADKQDKQS